MKLEEAADESRDPFCGSRRTGDDWPDFVRRFVDFPQEVHFLGSGVIRKLVHGALLPAIDGVDRGVMLAGPVSFVHDFQGPIFIEFPVDGGVGQVLEAFLDVLSSVDHHNAEPLSACLIIMDLSLRSWSMAERRSSPTLEV